MSKKSKFRSSQAKAVSLTPQPATQSTKYEPYFGSSRGFDFATKNLNIEIESHDKTIEAFNKKDNKQTAIQVPAFYTLKALGYNFSEVASGVNLVASIIAGLGFEITKDKDVQDIDLSKLLGGYSYFIKEFVKHYLVFGQVIPTIFGKDGANKINDFRIRNLPSHQIGLWTVEDYAISEFSWYNSTKLCRIQKGSFAVYKNDSPDSVYFGESSLTSLYDKLNALSLDQQSFNKFLENNSFFGAVMFANKDIDKDGMDILRGSADLLAKAENHYKAMVVHNVDKIEQIKQNVEHRYSIADKQYFKDDCYSSLLIPSYFAKGNTTGSNGLGQGEQTTHRRNLNEFVINPVQTVLEEFLNNFLIPTFFPDSGYVANCKPMIAESNAEIQDSFTKGYEKGIFTAKEVKKHGYNLNDNQITDEDDFRLMPNNYTVVKAGNLLEGSTEDGEVVDDLNENIEGDTSQDEVVETPTIDETEQKAELVTTWTTIKVGAISVQVPQITFAQTEITEQVLEAKPKIQISKQVQNQTRKQVFSFVEGIKDFDYNQNSMFDQFVDSKEFETIQKAVDEVLTGLYKVDLSSYKSKKVQTKAVIDITDPSYDPELYELIQSQVNDNLENQKDNLNLITGLLYFFGQTGKQIATNQATEQNQPSLALEKIQKINVEIQNWVQNRVNSIFNKSTGKPKPAVKDTENSTNKTIVKSIVDTTVDNIYQNAIDNANNQDVEAYDEFVKKELGNRVENIATTETMQNYQAGFTIAADEYQPKQKQWLPSRASRPRPSHKSLYGEIVDYDENYSIGYQHPNTEYRCQCSERIIF
jgi:Phage Mu protein F like protein